MMMILLAELQEVMGAVEDDESSVDTQDVEEAELQQVEEAEPAKQVTSSAEDHKGPSKTSTGGLLQTLQDRITNYQSAIANAKQANETSKARRYDRGLKTLESMLKAAKQGKPVNEEEMPPPVASGKSAEAPQTPLPTITAQESAPALTESETVSSQSQPVEAEVPITASEEPAVTQEEAESKTLLMTRHNEYKMAALRAKQRGDIEKAKEYMKICKKFSSVLEAMESGQPVDLSQMPPPPNDQEVQTSEQSTPEPQEPSPATRPEVPAVTVLQALQQRMDRYKSAAQQAKANGDDRKARMHERIVKQYQDAIRASKAGRSVNLAELPAPPGFPPFPGMESAGDVGQCGESFGSCSEVGTCW
ncbi:unnamed protein product [Staurois parvus]|uniref:DM14 domain-containing protein n=1 Tax=Staurois parvus TaxID=386267 RepID=A0ABN9DJ77_9NEOB|nr:unnamed protein product [Staurois parvus]